MLRMSVPIARQTASPLGRDNDDDNFERENSLNKTTTRNEEPSCSNCSIRPDVNCFSNTFFDYNYFFDNSKFFNVNNENFVIIFDLKYYVKNVYVAGNKNI